MKLRQIINGTLLTLAMLGVATAFLLVLLTGYLNQTVQSLEHTMTGVRFVERLEMDLRRFVYRSNIYSATGDEEYEALRRESEAGLIDNLAYLDVYLEGDEKRTRLATAEEAILAAISARYALEARGLPLEQLIAESTPPLSAALRSTRELVQVQLAEVEAVTLEAARWDRWANVWALAAAAILLLGIAIVLAIVHQRVYMPLSRLQQTIHQFGMGDEQARALPSGPPELREIGDTFNQVADSLRDQRENRVTFLAAVAHDLRNPLTGIRGYTELIARRETLPPEEDIRRMVKLVGHEVDLLTRMLDDFLDTARIDAGSLTLHMERVDARRVPEPSVELFQAASERHSLQLTVAPEPLPIQCDSYRLEQVLNNLIGNAIKYSPAGGPVDVRVEQHGRDVRFSVSDRGMGIAVDDIGQLFQPFRRFGPEVERIPGAGLGLSVVRRIVEAHDGSVGVESEVGVGSTFWFSLPLAAEDSAQA